MKSCMASRGVLISNQGLGYVPIFVLASSKYILLVVVNVGSMTKTINVHEEYLVKQEEMEEGGERERELV